MRSTLGGYSVRANEQTQLETLSDKHVTNGVKENISWGFKSGF